MHNVAAMYIVRFSQAMYSVDEDSGIVQPVLILSNSSETVIIVQVLTIDESATGKILCDYANKCDK